MEVKLLVVRLSILYLCPMLLQAIALLKTTTSWKLRNILGKLQMRNAVTMATKIMAILSSALRRLALEFFEAVVMLADEDEGWMGWPVGVAGWLKMKGEIRGVKLVFLLLKCFTKKHCKMQIKHNTKISCI